MSDEFNKGYFGTGPKHTYEAQQGAYQRRLDDERARQVKAQEAERQQRFYEEQLSRAMRSPVTPVGSYDRPRMARAGAGDATPPSFFGCVKGCAVLGALLMAAYAIYGLNLPDWPAWLTWGATGALYGAAGGVVLYVALVILGVALKALAVAVKIAVYAALVVGLLYLVS